MSDLVIARNCCMTTGGVECFPEKPSWFRNDLSGPTGWILRDIKNYRVTFFLQP